MSQPDATTSSPHQERARVVIDPGDRVAPVPRRLFGAFVEHLGRCVYTGIYEPGHQSADAAGFRRDVLDLVRELGVSIVRYPGGNFVSGYRWQDGIGPVDERPARLDLAWHTLEPNVFGTDEFLAWCAAAGIEPMMAVNLGTAGVLEAVDLLDYVNGSAPTAMAQRRSANGHEGPYGVRMWCLGNEMDGPWQVGQMTPHEYARIALNTARAMRKVDPGLELVACGSSSPLMPTFGEWERVVLEECFDEVDYVSLHRYYQEVDGDLDSFLASGVDLDHFIDAVVATADHVAAKRHSSKRIDISMDEWNVWYQSRVESVTPSGDDWPIGPHLLEDHYTVADAVVVGSLLISLLRHCDRVTAACQAQLVNVIAPIVAEPDGPAWRQTIFHPFAQASRLARGDALSVRIDAPTIATVQHGEVPALDATATWDADRGAGAFYAVNRSSSSPLTVEVDLAALGGAGVTSASVLTGDPYLTNSADRPDAVQPQALDVVTDAGQTSVILPPVSWAVLELG
jgi:alpha-N-arabinofuranosidase